MEIRPKLYDELVVDKMELDLFGWHQSHRTGIRQIGFRPSGNSLSRRGTLSLWHRVLWRDTARHEAGNIHLTRETHTVRAGEIKTQAGGREILWKWPKIRRFPAESGRVGVCAPPPASESSIIRNPCILWLFQFVYSLHVLWYRNRIDRPS